MTRSQGFLSACAIVTALMGSLRAQAPTTATLVVTVVDQTGGSLPSATVTVLGLEDVTRATKLLPVRTSDKGAVTIPNLAVGRYSIQAEFTGFETGLLKDVRLKAGENKHVIVLALKSVKEDVTVAQDARAAAAIPSNSFRNQLTREEINALSDDPLEMAQQLIDQAGGNAIIKIDSFVGGTLPPKALIKSIHIVRDTFPAENHSAEADEIDIITQPGVGPLHGGFTTRAREGALNGRNPFVDVRTPERTLNFEGNVGGVLVQDKSSFSLSLGNRQQYDSPVATVSDASGVHSVVLGRVPNDRWQLSGLLDYALTRDQVLRLSYEQSATMRSNLGIGGYDVAERAYSTDATDHELRVSEAGPIGRRMYGNTRLQLHWADTTSHSLIEAPTIRVLDGKTTGGAQVAGGRHQRDLEFASDMSYVRGIHAVRSGVLFDGARYRSDDSTNYLGTFVFTSTEAFLAGKPANYTRRIGDPNISYWMLQSAAYIQDDITVRKGLTVSPGLRYEQQTHVGDRNGFAPRFGISWAPTASGKTTLRSSYGVFYNWLSNATFEQTLRVDGVRQQDINVENPNYPDVGSAGTFSTSNRYLLGPDVHMVRNQRFSAGVDQTLSPKARFSVLYSQIRFVHQARGANLNAPVNGARPDPRFANVYEVLSDASEHTQQITADFNVNLVGGVRNAGQALWNPMRTTMRLQYRISRAHNNTSGAFTPPPSGTLATEWAPSPGDRTHRLQLSVTSQALKNLSVQLSLLATSGNPYTITTGFDDNGDSIFNDRPAGVGRDTVRTPWQTNLNANLSYTIIRSASGANGRQQRLSLTMTVANLTNRANYTGFSGVMTSRFFLQPTNVVNPRKIDFGANFSF